jgi:hypothetical protein
MPTSRRWTLAIGVFVAACAAVAEACGSAAGSAAYPLISVDPHPTTQAGPPTSYEASPTPTCQRTRVFTPDGKKTIVIPPTPGLRAEALDAYTTRLSWWFNDVPDECTPRVMLLSVVASTDSRATPYTIHIDSHGEDGTKTITYPKFLDSPDVALASAYLPNGARSTVARVLIRRG